MLFRTGKTLARKRLRPTRKRKVQARNRKAPNKKPKISARKRKAQGRKKGLASIGARSPQIELAHVLVNCY